MLARVNIVSFLVGFGLIVFFGFWFCFALIWNYESVAMNKSTPGERKEYIWKFALVGGVVLALIWAVGPARLLGALAGSG